jgi:hypothetical protein
MRRMDTFLAAVDKILAAYAMAASYATAYPLTATCLLALGPVALVLLSRSPVGAVIVIGLAIAGLGLAIEVTPAGINARPFESPLLRSALALWGALWPIAIAFLIFGRPPAYADVGNVPPPQPSRR